MAGEAVGDGTDTAPDEPRAIHPPAWLEAEGEEGPPPGGVLFPAESPLETLLARLRDTEAYDADLQGVLTELHDSIAEFYAGTDRPFDASWFSHETLFSLLHELDRMSQHLKRTCERWSASAVEQETRRIEMNSLWQEMVSYQPPTTCRSPTARRGNAMGDGAGEVWSTYSDEFELLSLDLSRAATPLSRPGSVDFRGSCRPFGQRWWAEVENHGKAEAFLRLLVPHFGSTVDMLRLWLPLCEPCSASHLPDRLKAEMEELIDLRWNFVRLKCSLAEDDDQASGPKRSAAGSPTSAGTSAGLQASLSGSTDRFSLASLVSPMGHSASAFTSMRSRHGAAPLPARPAHCMEPHMRRAYLQAQTTTARDQLQRRAPDLYEALTAETAEAAAAQQAGAARSAKALDARVAYIALLYDALDKLGAALQQVTGAIAKEAQARVADLLQDLLEMGYRADRVLKSTTRMRLEWSPEGVRLLCGAAASPKTAVQRRPASSIEPLQTETILLLRASCRRGLAPECARLLMEFRDLSASYAALLLTAVDSELSATVAASSARSS
eukprot:EG_transcript_4625